MNRTRIISQVAAMLTAVCVAATISIGVACADTVVTASTTTRWVSGTTYDLATGDTLEGIDVALWPASSDGSITVDSAEATTTTDPEGDYALPIAGEGTYVVKFRDPLGVRQQLQGLGTVVSQPPTTSAELMVPVDGSAGGSASGGDPGSGSVDPSSDTTITGQDAYLGLPWTLAPTVVDGVTGDPLPGITVRIAPSGTTDFAPDATTDASGTFSASGLPVAGVYQAYLVDPRGELPEQWAFDQMSAATSFDYPAFSGSATSTPQIVMHHPGSLKGQVTLSADGSAVSAARIELWRDEPDGSWKLVDTTMCDAGGVYSFSDVAPGIYNVAASDPLGELPKSWSFGDPATVQAKRATAQRRTLTQLLPPVPFPPGLFGGTFVGDETTATADVSLGWEDASGSTGPLDPSDPMYYIDGPGASLGYGVPAWWFRPIRPRAPESVQFRRAFSLSGSFHAKTRHRGWMRVECCRLENGRWVVRKTLSAKTHRLLNYVDYFAKIKLPKTGQWRIRVRWTTATSGNVWSKFRYVTVTRP